MKKAQTEQLINAAPPEKTTLTKRLLRSGHASSLPKAIRKLLGLKVGKRKDQWGSKSMRRGVQISKEARQRPARLAFIHESQRQSIEAAAKNRAAYLKRRGARWRGVVEKNLPGMFLAALGAAGLPMPLGPEKRGELGGFKGAPVLGMGSAI